MGKIRQVVVLCASSLPFASTSLPSAVPVRLPAYHEFKSSKIALARARIMTMHRHFKTTVLLLLLLLVPLRGMAAIAMWHCAENQRNSMSAHHHAELRSSQGEASVSPSDHQHHESPSRDTPPSEPGSPAASACSACAACCMGGSISPSGMSSFFFAPLGASRIAFVEQHFTGVVPAQLERPPLVQSL